MRPKKRQMQKPVPHTEGPRQEIGTDGQGAGNLQMALLKPRFVAQAQYLYENRPLPMG